MGLAFSIARRFLSANKGQTFLITLGIAIGVSVQIFIGSLIQGLQMDLVDTTIGSQSQITITSKNEDGLILDQEELLQKASTEYEDVIHVSPVAEGPALATLNEENYSILLRGLDFEAAEGIYQVRENLTEGTLPEGSDEVIIGKELQEETAVSLGDSITVLSGSGESREVSISGIFDLGAANLNRSWILTNIPTAQELFVYGDAITSIEMQTTDVFLADTLAQEMQAAVPDILKVDNWKDQNAALLSGLNGQSVSSYMIQIFVLISVLLGIASVLAITVVQKSRQIGILKAMGIQDGNASQIFVLQGFMLGIGGAILGILLGLGLAYAFTRFALNPDGTPVVPLYIDPAFIALSAGVAVLVSTLAALIPARKTSRLDPIEVIRNA